ncbi:extended synaptotagmin-2-like [Gigantopelta aegis]|uniref:extended synaptotagmin-2-like n=1 Tax=Gigantopelta aegis TaxID=1735272 RepID=UPI001B88E0EE|nr:extended synaptotagmin-2-like [Gigantopelta aegis]
MSSAAKDKEKGDSPGRKSADEDTMLVKVVTEYFKLAGATLFVWFFGYFQFSPSWLLLGLVVYSWKAKHNKDKKWKIKIAQEIARDEREAILARVEELPSWVYFPDVERAEWVNKIIDQLWPYIGDYVKKLLIESIEPQIRASLPDSLKSFKFSKIDLGDIPPRVGGVKVYTNLVRRDEVYMDLEITYSSDADVAVKVKGINAGIKDLHIHGTLRVIFKPLISKMPLIGGISVFFLNSPNIDFNLTSLANAFDVPGLNDMLHKIVSNQVASMMVLPNRISIQMADGVNLNKLRYPQPQGVLRISLVEAKDLIKADISITGKGKSDPYATASVGALTFQTKVIDNTVNPLWNQTFEAIIDAADGQMLDLFVLDKDPGNKDDKLGDVQIEISQVKEKGLLDDWLQLENIKKGFIHTRLQWLYLANDPLELDRIMQQIQEENKDDESISSCILLVNLDSARDLPRGKKTLSEPSPMVKLCVGRDKQESTAKANTNEPRWEENFRFLVHNPNYQNMEIEVWDSKSNKLLGSATIKLKDLLVATDMVLDQQFQIRNVVTTGQVHMRLALRVLTPELNPEWMDKEEFIDPPPENQGSPVDKPPEGTSVDQNNSQKSNNQESDKPAATSTSPASTMSSSTAATTQGGEDMLIPSANKEVSSEVRQRKPQTSNVEYAGQYDRGRIQMTFRYSVQRQRLIIVIHQCVNLLPLDSNNLSDPYVRMYLLPDKSSGSKRKTQVVKDNLNPVFDETFEYSVNPTELSSRTLEIMVKNQTGVFSSSEKVMGVVSLDLATLDTTKAITEWFDLQPEVGAQKVSMVESDV